MDGWGDNPVKEFNAVEAAKTPNLDALTAKYAHADIQASGIYVGLPDGQMGNSESRSYQYRCWPCCIPRINSYW